MFNLGKGKDLISTISTNSSNRLSLLAIALFLLFLNANLINASQEFPVYRMQQFDLQGAQYGSRATLVNLEARTLNSKSFARKAVLIRLNSFTIEKFRSLVSQSVGAIIIALPHKYDNSTREVSFP